LLIVCSVLASLHQAAAQSTVKIGSADARHDLAGVVVLQTEEVIAQPLILVTKVNPNGLITKVVEAAARVTPQ
jgi:hypothetical protein